MAVDEQGSDMADDEARSITRNEVEWSLYESNNVGPYTFEQTNGSWYQVLIRVLFCIQECKQEP